MNEEREAPARLGSLLDGGGGAALAALAAILLYAPSLGYGWLWDDIPQVVDNPWLRDPGSLSAIFGSDSWSVQGGKSGFYRPLLHTAYLLIYQVFGPNATAFHAVNVLLHGANAALLVLLVRRVIRRSGGRGAAARGLPLLAGLLFAAHPANAVAAAWVASLDNLLFAFFALLALLWHGAGGPLRGGAATALAVLLSLLSRETALVVPALLLAGDLGGAGGPIRGRLRDLALRHGLVGMAVAAYFALRVSALGGFVGGGGIAWRALLLDGPALLAGNLRNLLVPFPLRVWQDYASVTDLGDTRFLLALAFLAAAGVLLLRGARRAPLALLGTALLLLPLLPALYRPAMLLPLAPNRLYLPSAGLAILAANWLLGPPAAAPRLRVAAAAALVCSLAVGARLWAPVFAGGPSYWGAAVRDSPGRWMPHLQLGAALVEEGRIEEGSAELRMAAAIDPRDPLAHYHLAAARLREGRRAEAAAEYREALRRDPGHVPSLTNLAQIALEAGDSGAALPLLSEATRLAPDHPWVRNRYGVALLRAGRGTEGLRHLEEAVRIAPWEERYRRDLAQARELLRAPGDPTSERGWVDP